MIDLSSRPNPQRPPDCWPAHLLADALGKLPANPVKAAGKHQPRRTRVLTLNLASKDLYSYARTCGTLQTLWAAPQTGIEPKCTTKALCGLSP